MNPKLKFHFLVTVILFGNLPDSFAYSSNKRNPTNMELIDFAQKQFQDELVLDIESTTRYPTYLLKSLLKPINEE